MIRPDMFAQIVRFTLRPGCSREAFVRLSGEMAAWLRAQPGFVAYELYEGAEGWMDRIAWDSAASAQAARAAFLASGLAQPVTDFIETGHESFFGEAVIVERTP